MAKPKRVGSIEISEDMDFQRKSWRVQRIGWVIMLGIAIASLFGAFGDGPLSSAEKGDASSGFRISYERFPRHNATEVIDFEVDGVAIGADTMRIWIDRQWLSGKEIRSMSPEPAESALEGTRIIYAFTGNRAASGRHVRMHLEPRKMGRVRGEAGLVGGRSFTFGQFVYP
jgi:hypothetical protein